MKLNDRTLFILLMLYVATRAKRAAAGVPEGQTEGDERMLQPGVYWYCCSPAEAQEFVRWLHDRTLMIVGTKLLGSNGVDCAVVLFETNGAAYWTLTGLPQPAPAGMATTLEALTAEPSLAEFFLKKGQQALQKVIEMDRKIQQWLDKVFNPSP